MRVILIVEDDKEIRDSISQFFEENDFTVKTAENGIIGIEVLQANKDIQLIISDIDMPIMNGIAMVEKIRNELGYHKDDLPIVLLSAVNPSIIKEKFKQLDVLFSVKADKAGLHQSLLKPAIKLIDDLRKS